MSQTTPTIILGAGVCGLAAAYKLLERQPGARVTLLEQEDRPGGLARTLTLRGQVADLGPHRIFTELPDVQAFLEDLVGPALETVTRSSQMWLRGKFIDYPPRPAEIIPHLGIATLAGAGASWAAGKATKLAGFRKDVPESFESLMLDAFGRGLYELLVGPYARKVWKMDPAQLHGDIARVRVSAGGLDQMIKKVFVREKEGEITAVKKFHYIAGGVESLVHKLREGVESRGGNIVVVRKVVDVEPRDGGVIRVRAVVRDSGSEETFDAAHAISTIPVGELVDMLQRRRPEERAAKAASELRFIANFLVCVVVPRSRVSESQWLYFPGEDCLFNRGYEPKNFHASMGDADEAMLVLEVTCHEGDAIWNATDAWLTDQCLDGLDRIGLIKRGEVLATHVHRIPMTYPVYDLGYRERLDSIWRYLEGTPNILSAGRQGLFLHNNMDHSIHMGFRAADRLAEAHQNPAAAFYSEVRRFQQFRIVD